MAKNANNKKEPEFNKAQIGKWRSNSQGRPDGTSNRTISTIHHENTEQEQRHKRRTAIFDDDRENGTKDMSTEHTIHRTNEYPRRVAPPPREYSPQQVNPREGDRYVPSSFLPTELNSKKQINLPPARPQIVNVHREPNGVTGKGLFTSDYY